MQTEQLASLKELQDFAEKIVRKFEPSDSAYVLGLSGDLGAGKTALTKAIAKTLGVEGEITSPTFVVMKSYNIPNHAFFKTLVHIDAYRIESDEEMHILKFTELIQDPSKLIVIEWPEQIEKLIPQNALRISLEIVGGETREVSYGN